MDRADIKSRLESGIWDITFTKVDGTERTMPCTLDPAILPPVNISEDRKPVRNTNPDTMRVYVTDVQQWRSFRVANLISIEPQGGNNG